MQNAGLPVARRLPFVSDGGDTILPSQFFAMRRSATSEQPIQRLMLAVLGDAIDCFLSESLYRAYPASRRARLRDEAARWLLDEAAVGPFSFNWICEGLGIDASHLRGGVRRIEGKMTLSKGL